MMDKTNPSGSGVSDMLAQIRAYQSKVQSAAMQSPQAAGVNPFASQLEGLQSLANPAQSPVQSPSQSSIQGIGQTPVHRPSFAETVGDSLSKVNELQKESARMREAYEKGESVPLTDVVLGMQKSSLAFEATLQVRNKVMKAYEDILNMPV